MHKYRLRSCCSVRVLGSVADLLFLIKLSIMLRTSPPISKEKFDLQVIVGGYVNSDILNEICLDLFSLSAFHQALFQCSILIYSG